MTSPLPGPAFIAQMPPSPETSRRWWTMYCRECGIEETMYETPDDPRLIEHRDAHNRDVHGASPLPTDEDARERLHRSLEVAMLGTTDGGLIDPESDIPAGEMFRLASEWLDAQIAKGFRRSVVSTPAEHGMLPGSHEHGGPQCRCGAAWDRWDNRCTRLIATLQALPAVSAPPTITDEAARVETQWAYHDGDTWCLADDERRARSVARFIHTEAAQRTVTYGPWEPVAALGGEA